MGNRSLEGGQPKKSHGKPKKQIWLPKGQIDLIHDSRAMLDLPLSCKLATHFWGGKQHKFERL